ncbi:MAG: hypothetical protein EPN47_06030 [Acidobacteria bacterium]|nr:MAG: hypothetical protein EPN47_06030 [Acidobacteriota bacterium]
MRAQQIKLMVGIMVTALALAGLPLFGQGQAETSTGVARVSLIKGDVSMERGDSSEWVAVTVNTPLVPGDTIATGPGSHAEAQLDYSNVLRLADNAEVKIADLNNSRIQLQVARGTVDLAVFGNNQANSEVDTPNVAVQPLQQGTYRIDVNSDELSLVTVRDGQAQVSTPQGSTNVSAGQQITVEGTQNPQYQIADARQLDSWDNWNRERNGVINRAQSYGHVNQYYTGAQDLDTYGRWTYVPGYDWCWTPYVNAGWVPYNYGRWVWEPFYGWTWVSYDPWGWAPYHYGRWFYYGSSWCWWPGYVTPFYRPLWAPAYVAFIGFGYGYYHFSFGFGYGYQSIGWCPLGPGDEFRRWWGYGGNRSFTAININNYNINNTNINNYYGRGGNHGHGYGRGRGGYGGSNLAELDSNSHVRRAVVTMPSNRFGREAVPRNHEVVTSAMLRNASVVHGTLPVVPTHESLRVVNRAPNVSAATRNRANNTQFYTRRTVAVPNSNHSFNNQEASIRRMVETHNTQAPGANRQATSNNANRGFQMSRQAGPQNQDNSARQNPAPIVRGNQQGRENGRAGAVSSAQASRPNYRQFGSGAPAEQARGNQGRQNSAPVVQENPQQRQNVNPGVGRNAQPSQSGFRSFGSGSPAAQPRGNQGPQNSGRGVRENPAPQQNISPSSGQPQTNWRRFSGTAPQGPGTVQNQNSQRFNRGGNSAAPIQQNNNGFRRFTPQSAPQPAPQNQERFNNNSRAVPQGSNRNSADWNRFQPQREAPPERGGGGFYNGGSRTQGYSQPRYESRPGSNNPGNYSRPPLQLNQPIVSGPRSPSYGGYGGSRPSYQERSAPSYSQGPRGGSSPSFHGNSGGGSHESYSAPSHSSGGSYGNGGGGGHSNGGGGGGGNHRR